MKKKKLNSQEKRSKLLTFFLITFAIILTVFMVQQAQIFQEHAATGIVVHTQDTVDPSAIPSTVAAPSGSDGIVVTGIIAAPTFVCMGSCPTGTELPPGLGIPGGTGGGLPGGISIPGGGGDTGGIGGIGGIGGGGSTGGGSSGGLFGGFGDFFSGLFGNIPFLGGLFGGGGTTSPGTGGGTIPALPGGISVPGIEGGTGSGTGGDDGGDDGLPSISGFPIPSIPAGDL